VLAAEAVSNFGAMLSRVAIPWPATLSLDASPLAPHHGRRRSRRRGGAVPRDLDRSFGQARGGRPSAVRAFVADVHDGLAALAATPMLRVLTVVEVLVACAPRRR